MFEPKATAPHLDSTNRVGLTVVPPTSGLPPINGHRQVGPAGPFRAKARNRCAIARCAGSPTVSAVTGGKIVEA